MKAILFLILSVCLASVGQAARRDNTHFIDETQSGETYDFRFEPIQTLVGLVTLDLDVGIAPDWTLGPTLTFGGYHISSNSDYSSSYDIKESIIGVRANWFRNGRYHDGLYVGPSLRYVSLNLTTTDTSGGNITGTATGPYIGCLVGYGWFWKNFNMMLGGGANVGLGETEIKITDSSGQTTKVSALIGGLDLEYSLGWTF